MSDLSKLSVSALISRGAALWDTIHSATQELEAVKDLIRAQSRGVSVLYGRNGDTCLVTPQPSQVVVRKEVDINLLRERLGEDFDRLFQVTEVPSIREGFEAVIPDLDPQVAKFALAAVDQVTHKARVAFKSGGLKS